MSSSAPQFKSINLVLRLLYGPTLTSVHGYWKNRNINYKDLCQKVTSLLFKMLSMFVIALLPRSKCFNFMASVTFCSISCITTVKRKNVYLFLLWRGSSYFRLGRTLWLMIELFVQLSFPTETILVLHLSLGHYSWSYINIIIK